MVPPQMWLLEYTEEAKFYFLDNYPYTFELLVEIEKLKFEAEPGGLEIEANLFRILLLDHLVYYRKEETRLVIAAVKPVG